MSVSTTWSDVWEGEKNGLHEDPIAGQLVPTSARVAATVAPTPSTTQEADVDTILMEIARLRADLARRDAITIVVIGVLLTAILQHISRMHEEFNMMASRVGILR